MGSIGVVILAAGGSTRMGRPKQLLPYGESTLLRHAAAVAVASGLGPVIVVVGSDPDRMAAELDGLPVTPVANPDWERGLGTSVRAGVRAALEMTPDLDAVILTLADLPLVTPRLLGRMAREHRERSSPIVACRYGGTAGVPALFGRSSFAALQSLPDDRGAKGLIAAAGSGIGLVDFPGGSADIDTPADYARLAPGQTTAAPPAP
jgi:molybdenum cofactor cytidylyltransferase